MVSGKKAGVGKARSSPNDFHLTAVAALQDANVPFLIGGAYVVEVYAGVSRRTKDFDLCIRPQDVEAALDALACAGFQTEFTSPHWLAKARHGRDYIDLIFAPAMDYAKSTTRGSSGRMITNWPACT